MVLGNILEPQLDQLKQRFHNFTGAIESCRNTNLFQCAVTDSSRPGWRFVGKSGLCAGKLNESSPGLLSSPLQQNDEMRNVGSVTRVSAFCYFAPALFIWCPDNNFYLKKYQQSTSIENSLGRYTKLGTFSLQQNKMAIKLKLKITYNHLLLVTNQHIVTLDEI